jgi:hypothetical protein
MAWETATTIEGHEDDQHLWIGVLKVLGTTVKRLITLYGDDAVSDDEMRADCCTDVQDALVGPRPMQNGLRPAITRSGTMPNMFSR